MLLFGANGQAGLFPTLHQCLQSRNLQNHINEEVRRNNLITTMTQNKASGIIYKLQPNTSSHYLQ